MALQIIPIAAYDNRQFPRWRWKNLLPDHGYAIIYGDYGTNKSFFALNLAAHIAGPFSEWCGQKICRSHVIYVSLEADSGLKQRKMAWEMHYGMPFPPIDIIPHYSINVSDDVVELQKLATPDTVIIIDTLHAAALGMDENGPVDGGRIIHTFKNLGEKALCLVIHHQGKDKNKKSRGYSGFVADSDASFLMEKNGDLITLTPDRIKNSGISEPLQFKTAIYTVGIDDDDEPVTSCVIESTDIPAQQHPTGPTGIDLQIYLVLENFPAGATAHVWKKTFCDLYRSTNPTCADRTPGVIFDRGKKRLIEQGFVLNSDGIFTINHATTETNDDNMLLQINDDCEFIEFGDTECTDTAATIVTNDHVAIESDYNISNVAIVADTTTSEPSKTTDIQQSAATATSPVPLTGETAGLLQLHVAADAATREEGFTVAGGDDPCYDPRNSNSGLGTAAVAVAQICDENSLEGREGFTLQQSIDPTATPAPTTTDPTQTTANLDEPRQHALSPSRQPTHERPTATPDRSNSTGEAPAAAVTVAEIPAAVAAQIDPTISTFHAKITKIHRQPTPPEPRLRQGTLIPPTQIPTGYQEGAA